MAEPPKPSFPKPRARDGEPYRESSSPMVTPVPAPAAAARIVHRPDPVSEPEEAPALGALAMKKERPKLTKDEVNALLEVSGTNAGIAQRRRGPWWNPRILVMPGGGVIWSLQAWVPTPVVILILLLWGYMVVKEVQRLLSGKRGW